MKLVSECLFAYNVASRAVSVRLRNENKNQLFIRRVVKSFEELMVYDFKTYIALPLYMGRLTVIATVVEIPSYIAVPSNIEL